MMRSVGIKVNSLKCSFRLNTIPYLGYLVPQEGIKTDSRKLQGIIDLGRPTKTTEAQVLISMVQYYRGMWTRWLNVISCIMEVDIIPKGVSMIWNDDMEVEL